MALIKCDICGKEFEYQKMSSCRTIFRKHIKSEHKIDFDEYNVKYHLNGKWPTCACGCGGKTRYNYHDHCWNKYVADSHVGKVNGEIGKKNKEEMLKSKKIYFDRKAYYESRYDLELASDSINDFKTKEYTLSDLEEKYKLDRRTLKKMWIELELITGDEYSKIASYLKYITSRKTLNAKFFDKNESAYTWIFNLIQSNPQKYNINNLLDEYNKHHAEKITDHKISIYKRLKEIYGDQIDFLLQTGYHSLEEYDFYKVLKFYFPKLKVKIGLKLATKETYYIYDFCIKNKYIIEYDSNGQYHNKENIIQRDIEKESFAKLKGFKFMRLKYGDIKNPETINRLKKWLNL